MTLMETKITADKAPKGIKKSALNQRSYQRSISGFTLIELLVVIGIGLALLGVSVLGLIGLRSGQGIEIEARQLVAVLQSAQEKAIGAESESRWGVYFDIAGARDFYYLFQVDEALKADPDYVGMPGAAISSHAVNSNIALTLTDPLSTSSVVFSKAAGRPNGTAIINLTTGDATTEKNVTVNTQGRIDY